MKKLTVAVAALVTCLLLAPSRTTAADPDIRVVDLAGLDAALAQHRGEAVLLNFWAIWCQPCVAELPELLEVAREYRGRGGVVLTVSYDLMVPEVTKDEVVKQMVGFVAARKMDVPVLIYNAADYDAINQRFGLPGPIPMTIAIDRAGAVVERHAGRAGKDKFTAMLRKGIGESR